MPKSGILCKNSIVRISAFFLLTFTFCLSWACRPAAPPVSVSNGPRSPSTTGRRRTCPWLPSKPMGEMSWTTDDDKVQKLGDLKGKAVILDFWATNCPPCRAGDPASQFADREIWHRQPGDRRPERRRPETSRKEYRSSSRKQRLDYPIAYPENELSRFIFSERDDIPQTLVSTAKARSSRRSSDLAPRSRSSSTPPSSRPSERTSLCVIFPSATAVCW